VFYLLLSNTHSPRRCAKYGVTCTSSVLFTFVEHKQPKALRKIRCDMYKQCFIYFCWTQTAQGAAQNTVWHVQAVFYLPFSNTHSPRRCVKYGVTCTSSVNGVASWSAWRSHTWCEWMQISQNVCMQMKVISLVERMKISHVVRVWFAYVNACNNSWSCLAQTHAWGACVKALHVVRNVECRWSLSSSSLSVPSLAYCVLWSNARAPNLMWRSIRTHELGWLDVMHCV